jgi:nicotinamidase-related amidase
MLNDFLQAWAPASRQRLVQATNELVATLRSHHRPVIWVRQDSGLT